MEAPYYLDDLALKTYDDYSTNKEPLPHEVLKDMISGKHDWYDLYKKYQSLSHSRDVDLTRYWKLIRDGRTLLDISNIIHIKQENDKTRDMNPRMKIVADYFGDKMTEVEYHGDDMNHEPEFVYNITWIEIFRRVRQSLERIVKTYENNERFIKLNEIFDHGGTAQELLNDLLMLQTRPIGEAHVYLDVDEYTGIHEEREEYIKVPDEVTLNNIEGEPTTVSLKNLKNDAWSGSLYDADHDWYDEDMEGDIPSQAMYQWRNQELAVTKEYWELKSRYMPALMEIIRRLESGSKIKEIENSRLVLWLRHALRTEFRNGTPIQDIAAFVAIDMPIEIKVNGNVSTVLDQFEDDIIDSIPEQAGIYDYSEYEYEPILEEFHKQTIELLKEKGIKYSPKWSPTFIISAFKSITEDQLDVGKAISVAYDDFREAVSPTGFNAFRQTMSDGGTPSQAMRAFYQAAKSSGEYIARDKVCGASDKGVILLTASSGYSRNRSVAWSLFKLKANQGEVFVPHNASTTSKVWLHTKLKSLFWSDQLINKLAE